MVAVDSVIMKGHVQVVPFGRAIKVVKHHTGKASMCLHLNVVVMHDCIGTRAHNEIYIRVVHKCVVVDHAIIAIKQSNPIGPHVARKMVAVILDPVL